MGDTAGALLTFERAVREFGLNPVNLCTLLDDLGRDAEAVDLLEAWIKTRPFGPTQLELLNLALFLAALQRYDEARLAVQQTSGQSALRLRARVEVAAAGDWATAERAATVLSQQQIPPRWRREVLLSLASAQAASGRLTQAFRSLQDAGDPYALAIMAAAVNTRIDDVPWAGADTSRIGRAGAALWAAQVGDTASAGHYLIEARGMTAPDRRVVGEELLAPVEARLAASVDRWDEVARMLRPHVTRTRFRNPPINQLMRWTIADAYQRIGQPDSALRHLEDIAAWRGFWTPDQMLRGLTHSFAHQRLVVLYARMGRLEDAHRHWKIFSETFTNPDPEVRYLIDEAREALAEAERRGG